MTDEEEFEAEQEQDAAAEAGAIGGRVSSEPPTEFDEEISEADRPLSEAGEGEAEGFELAEGELEEHASHGDDHTPQRILEDAASMDEDEERDDKDEYGEADSEEDEDA
jgi:hypothetical protein